MKTVLKTLVLSSIPLLTGAAAGAGIDPIAPATQPATQPVKQTVAVSNNSPLVIPDGTSGPVQPNVRLMSISGFRD